MLKTKNYLLRPFWCQIGRASRSWYFLLWVTSNLSCSLWAKLFKFPLSIQERQGDKTSIIKHQQKTIFCGLFQTLPFPSLIYGYFVKKLLRLIQQTCNWMYCTYKMWYKLDYVNKCVQPLQLLHLGAKLSYDRLRWKK